MERKEYFRHELPAELLDAYKSACMGLEMGCVGVTHGGVRYRIYRDKRQKSTAKTFGIDITDALKGADVPPDQIAAAVDKIGYGAEDRRVVLVEIAEGKVNGAKAANSSRDDAQI
jgi:tellurite resistance-related uncharacterized protein